MKSIVWQLNKLKPKEKYVLEYLLTNSHTNPIGYYYLPEEYMTSDLNLARTNVEEAINGLVEKGFIVYDYSASTVAIANYKNYFGFDMNSMSLDIFDTIPISGAFRKCFRWLSDCISGEKAIQIVHHEKVRESLMMEIDSTDSDETYYTGFDMFWAVYPRKTGRDKAQENYMELVKIHGVEQEDLVKAAVNYNFDYKDFIASRMLFLECADQFLDPERRLFSKYINEIETRICSREELDGVMDDCPF